MRSRMKTTLALLLVIPIAGVSARSALAQAAQQPGASSSAQVSDDDKPRPFEVDGGYAYMRTNQPPGSCGCFGMQGGNGSGGGTVKDTSYTVGGGHAGAHG